MKRAIAFVSATVLVLALGTPARALEMRIGAAANYGTENTLGVGPRVDLELAEYVPGLRLSVDAHKFFDNGVYDDIDGLAVESGAWDAGLHVGYDITTLPIAEGATLYAGLGLLYAKRTYDHRLRPASEELSAAQLTARYDKLKKLQEKYESDSGVGCAISVGSTFNTGWTVLPFVEARYAIGVVDELLLSVGILFSTGSAAK